MGSQGWKKAGTLLALAFLSSACTSTDEAGLGWYSESYQVAITEGDAPEGATPVQLLYYYKKGFYVLGYAPVVEIGLREAVAHLAERAHEIEADGIAHLSYEIHPASFFRFSVFPIPDWSAWIQCQGMAYRLAPNGAGEEEAPE